MNKNYIKVIIQGKETKKNIRQKFLKSASCCIFIAFIYKFTKISIFYRYNKLFLLYSAYKLSKFIYHPP